MPKISVIIPVYNVEEYLPQSLNSVVNQTHSDIEIICINDCSTDNSLKILEEYTEKDCRIKLINFSKNQGVSVARNAGIDIAEGDYIAFLDPDDWWELELLEKAIKKLQLDNADVILFSHNEIKNNEIIKNKEKLKKIQDVINGTNYINYLQDFSILIWDKIYRKDFIKNRNIKFIQNIHQTEDVLFSLEVFSNNPIVTFIAENLYNYRLNREGSAMYNSVMLVSNQIKAFKTMLECNFYINADDKYKQQCINIIFGGVVYFYLLTKEKKFSLQDFLEVRSLVKYMEEKIPMFILENISEYKHLKNITSVNLNRGISCLK